jgi:hypothetical protein
MNETDKNEINSDPEESVSTINQADDYARISELAYYKAESRGFEPGHEVDDWLEAEQEYYAVKI